MNILAVFFSFLRSAACVSPPGEGCKDGTSPFAQRDPSAISRAGATAYAVRPHHRAVNLVKPYLFFFFFFFSAENRHDEWVANSLDELVGLIMMTRHVVTLDIDAARDVETASLLMKRGRHLRKFELEAIVIVYFICSRHLDRVCYHLQTSGIWRILSHGSRLSTPGT